ncbi:unnamed protein product [Trichobilharzia regenti]|nr:unnamed protein product [Trichobilharzia regenti]
MHKSRQVSAGSSNISNHFCEQIDDGIPKEPEVSGVAEPSTLKPPMVKKRKKKARKLPNLDSGDGDMKKMKDGWLYKYPIS